MRVRASVAGSEPPWEAGPGEGSQCQCVLHPFVLPSKGINYKAQTGIDPRFLIILKNAHSLNTHQ